MYFPYIAKELVRRKGRTITNLLAVAVLVAMPIILTSIMNGYADAVYLPFKSVGADLVVQRSASAADASIGAVRIPFGKGLFTDQEAFSISAVHHVLSSAKSLVVWQFDKGKFISIEGLEPGSFVSEKLKSGLTSGRFLEANDGDSIVVEKHFARFYSLKVGSSLKLGDSTFQVVGIAAAEGESQVSAENVYMNLADAQKLLGRGGYSQIYLRLDSLSSEDAVRTEVNRLNPQAVVVSSSSIATSLSNAVSIYERFRTFGAAILALIVAFILFQVSATGLLERRREIGVMQTVGWTTKNVSRQVIFEAVLNTILGCALGLAASFVVIAVIGSVQVQVNVPGLSNDLTTLTAPLTAPAATALEFSGLAIIISIVVSLLVARRISGMKPLINIRN